MLAWIDLEMTGLDPLKHHIVEIATLITDNDLQLIAEGPELIIHQSDAVLAGTDDVPRQMHEASGLMDQIKASDVSLADATAQTLEFLKSHIPEAGTVPLCGNSIGTDRRFLAIHMPEVEDFLSYRSVDVSTLKELARRWSPEVFESAPTKAGGHRALDDIRESLTELVHYRDNFLATPAETD